MAQYPTLWFWRSDPIKDGWWSVKSYSTDEHPHPFTVESDVRPTEAEPFSTLDRNEDHLRVWIDHEHLPNAPDLWYLLINYNETFGGVSSLMAFTDNRFPDGTILDVEQFRKTGKSAADQIGAVQWRRSTATLEQIYVHKAQRRKGISTKLINVADILVVARRTDAYLNGGGHLTDDGAALAQRWSHSARLTERVGSYSSMDSD